MRLKVYHAPNIGAAMAMVRDELGPDALILANRYVDGGVELTAAQEPPAGEPTPVPSRSPAPAPPQARPPLIADEQPAPVRPPSAPKPVVPDLTRAGTLRWHGVPAALAARLGPGELSFALAKELSFDNVPCRAHDKPLLLVGPPGAGKTLTTARLATRLKLAKHHAQIITADGRRAGAAEQLAAFTRLLGFTLIVAESPTQLARAVTRRKESEPVLVDMPGLNPSDPQDAEYLRNAQSALDAVIALVLPAGLDPAEAEDLALAYKALGATLLVATRLDQCRRLGGVLAAADTGLALAEAGVGPGVADGLVPLTPQFLAERLAGVRRAEVPPPSNAPVSPLALLARARSEPSR